MSEMFMDRTDAGRQLAKRLKNLKKRNTVILGIAYGGIPVAREVAEQLGLPFDVVSPRKLPIPWSPEAGFGAVASGGVVVLNDRLIREIGLSKKRIERIIQEVSEGVGQRERLIRTKLPKQDLAGKHVIVVDDGIASGYTMLTAIRSAKEAGARRISVATPVASESAVRLIEDSSDEIICLIVSHRLPFAVADYYVAWHDLTEEEVLSYLPEKQESVGTVGGID